VGGSGGAAAVAEDPPVLTGSEEITTAATEAVAAAARAGADEVTVVAVDDAGRPSIEPVPLADAVDVALATAESLDVVAIEPPSYAKALETAPPPEPSDPDFDRQWAMFAFPFSALWQCGRGAGITVAVVDSGVQAEHPDLAGRVRPGAAIVNGAVQNGAGDNDVNGHGTHVAGIVGAGENGVGVVGVAPQVTILPVRVLDATGSGPNSDIGKGITWAVDHGAKVINVSIGSGTKSASVTTAVGYAVNHGVSVVAAAGNGGLMGNPPRYPAALPEVIAVGALDQNCDIASYSTNGNYVDVVAPGTDIWSTKLPSTWGSNSGTSMASPHVAALAALIIDARGSVSPGNMLRRLTSTATDAGPPGFDPAYGFGCINPIAAVNAR
jgi:subtilisin family serine protease